MRISTVPMTPTQNHVLLAYIADLELEVDRLRKHCQFQQQEACEAVKQIQSLCSNQVAQPESKPGPLAAIEQTTNHLAAVLRDLREPSGYHPAHDQVIAIAVRPLMEQVFRWQQRLLNAPHVALRLELRCEHIEWFPARFRHILDNLLSNALKYRDANKGETRVTLELRVLDNAYELRVSDNGMGLPPDDRTEMFELFYRSAPARSAGLGVGLPVVKLLVEQSGGTLTTQSGDGQGTTFVAVLPRFDMDDFLT
jgi:signal transduction histidine kinase